MTGELVRFEPHHRWGRLVLDRPDHGNRVGVAVMRDFIAALEEARTTDPDVLVITGSGPDFSIGRDQSEQPTGLSKRDNLALILDANRLLTGIPGITVAAVRGRALGFGTGVAAQCDLTIAADTAQFGFTEIHHGFAPAIVMTYLRDYVSRKAAVDLVVTGRRLAAVEAMQLGLVTRVVPAELLDAAVTATVEGLLSRPSAALRLAKSFLGDIGAVPDDERGRHALDALAPVDP